MRNISTQRVLCVAGCLLVGLISEATFAQHSPTEEAVADVIGEKEFSPYVGRTYPLQPLWGDQHLHTAISVDAGTMCRLGQEDA